MKKLSRINETLWGRSMNRALGNEQRQEDKCTLFGPDKETMIYHEGSKWLFNTEERNEILKKSFGWRLPTNSDFTKIRRKEKFYILMSDWELDQEIDRDEKKVTIISEEGKLVLPLPEEDVYDVSTENPHGGLWMKSDRYIDRTDTVYMKYGGKDDEKVHGGNMGHRDAKMFLLLIKDKKPVRNPEGKQDIKNTNIEEMEWFNIDGTVWADRDLVIDGIDRWDYDNPPEIPEGYCLPTEKECNHLFENNGYESVINDKYRGVCRFKNGLEFEVEGDKKQYGIYDGWFVDKTDIDEYALKKGGKFMNICTSLAGKNFLERCDTIIDYAGKLCMEKLKIRLVKDEKIK